MKRLHTYRFQKSRKKQGASVVELLVTSLLLAASMAVIGELMAVMTLSASRLTNRVDVVNDASQALLKIDADVRSASNFQTNHVSGALGQQKLILDVPVFSKSTSTIGNYPIRYDTVIYDLSVDPIKSDQYILKRSREAGFTPATLNPSDFPSSVTGEIVARGIVGPRSVSNSSVAIFSYFKKVEDPNDSTQFTVQELPLGVVSAEGSLVGVSIDLEMKRPNSMGGAESQSQQLTLHSESYLHSNSTN